MFGKNNTTTRKQRVSSPKQAVKRKSAKVARTNRKQLALTLVQVKRMAMVAGFVVIVGFVLWLNSWFSNPSNMTISNVIIQGDLQYLQKQALQPVIEKYVKTNLSLLDGVGLEEELETNPWVKDASLTKSWPRKLVINLVEHRPIAYWGEDQLLSRTGEIFGGALPDEREDFPLLYSPSNDGFAMGEKYLSILEQLKTIPFKVVVLTENERGSWEIRFDNGLIVKIGKSDQEKRLQRFVMAYHERLKTILDDIHKVDLRYTNGLAVAWK
jgi:cell division protein FtsQ